MKKINIETAKLSYKLEEAYKTIRTNIQFSGEDKRVIVFTSCTPDEGKSSVSMNLAIEMANAGKKTVIVDADLRKSVMLERLNIDEKVFGLTHLLSQQKSIADVVYMTNVPNLSMIFSGPVPPNPSELLGNTVFQKMVKTLRGVYDYVLIDCAPLGSVIDAAVVARECDGAVLVVEAGVISYKFVDEVKEQLERSGVPILGVILNKVDVSRNGYYSKYYGRYSKYGKYGKYSKYGKYGDAYGGYVSADNSELDDSFKMQ